MRWKIITKAIRFELDLWLFLVGEAPVPEVFILAFIEPPLIFLVGSPNGFLAITRRFLGGCFPSFAFVVRIGGS